MHVFLNVTFFWVSSNLCSHQKSFLFPLCCSEAPNKQKLTFNFFPNTAKLSLFGHLSFVGARSWLHRFFEDSRKSSCLLLLGHVHMLTANLWQISECDKHDITTFNVVASSRLSQLADIFLFLLDFDS